MKAINILSSIFFKNGGHRLEIFCNENNLSSVNLAKRLGYHLDGTMREYEFMDGEYQGIAIYSLLKNDC